MTEYSVGFSILLLGMLLLIGKFIRVKITLLQDLFLPSSVIAGFVALLLGPEVLGNIVNLTDVFHWSEAGLFPKHSLETWGYLPALMINVVFAALFLGKKLPTLSKVWNLAGPQIVLGYIFSFGQYIVGLLLVIFFLTPVFGVDPLAGALIEIGFVGGHGTAAGLGDTFAEMGFEDGEALATGMATVGVLGGAIIGITLINWGVRKQKFQNKTEPQTRDDVEKKGLTELDQRPPAGHLSTKAESIEPLSLHFGYIALSIILGYGILQGLVWIESLTWGSATGVYLIEYVPLFPLAMVGGIIVQYVLDRIDVYKTLDPDLISRIQGFALDILIVSSLATLELAVIRDNIVPFTVLALGGIIWTVFVFRVLAPRILTSFWFERGIGDFGQSMGVAATGLLLMKVADPDNDTPALESFGYKQILFEPIVGGGLFTAASAPLIFQFGAVNILIFLSIITVALLIFGLLYFKKMRI
ncbi:sodium/glutamate symporter [Natranaerobius thermophilus]|uniref:Sodium/glutamate symporter n=1 Tax=Natranaerobius thermophilus (strain ATCC BAA-1301 / DSM 18059 / JW/NM-WN-LF) TaxID=457570 RepID=B2A448_NATTJ|nr:sodium/glutamate symporter [Natranaerobius thermophilus]ACB86454.1 sodium/glutamate symporter [Natranaerobius thermophilus JW/NM-WN-LF]